MGASNFSQDTSSGKGSSTNSATSGQPQMGQPNQNLPAPYVNTVGQWDNPQNPTVGNNSTSNSPVNGKGKGG